MEPAVNARSFLDPDKVARLTSLEMVARVVVEGFLRGLHRSPFKGSSVEFTEHRAYMPGDEVSKIDWRTYARTDRYYVKEFEDETNLRATIVLDASASMAYGSNGLSKLHYSRCLAAAFSFLLVSQVDAVGLAVTGGTTLKLVPPRVSRSHLRSLLAVLEEARPGGEASVSEALDQVADSVKRRSLVIVLSDLLDGSAAILKSLARLCHMGCEVVVFGVMDPAELEFPFQNWTTFRGLERRGAPFHRLHIDARKIQKTYLSNLERHLAEIKDGCGLANMDYQLLDTRRPFEAALLDYVSDRARRR